MALAAMHYNENSNAGCQEAQRFVVTYPKAKQGGAAVRVLKDKPSYGRLAKSISI